MDHTRRNLIFARGDVFPPLRPPWSSEAAVLERCTGCGDCAAACPTGIILIGAGRHPEIDFHRGECTFCGDCARVCAEDVFDVEAPAAFDHVAAIGDECLVRVGVDCRACQDVCPEAAIGFRPRLGGPPLPALDAAACTGCGACLAPCPADAITIARKEREAVHA